MERFIVIVHDPDNHTWYAPVVEAPGEREARQPPLNKLRGLPWRGQGQLVD